MSLFSDYILRTQVGTLLSRSSTVRRSAPLYGVFFDLDGCETRIWTSEILTLFHLNTTNSVGRTKQYRREHLIMWCIDHNFNKYTYKKKGGEFRYLINLYHWYRAVTPSYTPVWSRSYLYTIQLPFSFSCKSNITLFMKFTVYIIYNQTLITSVILNFQ